MATVLIVDDQPDIRRLISWSLELLEVELHEATDGLSALQRVQELTPELVLLDIMMPGDIDGLEVCRRLKAGQAGKAPRVILMSARGQVADVEIGLAAGADAYLVKPFSPKRVIEAAERLLLAVN